MSKKEVTTPTKSPKLTVPEIIDYCKNNLGITFNRMVYRKQYFENNTDIKNAYQFARKVLDYYASK